MTALQAAIGRSQLQRIETVLALKRKIASWYDERLAEIPQIELHPASTPEKEGVYWMYSILLPDSATRERVMDALAEDRIETRPFFLPMSTLPPFRQQSSEALPVSLDLSRRGMNLPSSPLLTEEEVDRVCDGIRTALGMAAIKTVFALQSKEAA